MKLKDYFKKLKEQGKISIAEYDAFLETVPEGEIPDEIFNTLQDNFLTVDRALTHRDVNTKLRAQILDPIDKDISAQLQILAEIDPHGAAEIERVEGTYRKSEALKKSLKIAFDKAKKSATGSGDGEARKRIEELEAFNKALEKANKEKEANFSVREKDLQTKMEKQIKDLKLNYALKDKIKSYNFADEFKPKLDSVTKIILSDLLAENHLVLGENEQIQVMQPTENGGFEPKFNGNDVVTVESLLDKQVDPFIKKNNGTTTGDTKPTQIYVPPTNGANPRRGATISATIRK